MKDSQKAKKLLTLTLASLLILTGCQKQHVPNLKTIALTQIIEHKAIDAEREGFIAGLKEAGFEDGKNISIHFENAQGSIATAAQIATKFISLKPAMIVALTTPSAQSVVLAASKTDIPVIFSTVTDPVGAKIVTQNEAPRTDNVTGISDYLSASAQLDCIQKLLPHAKKIGVIYNPGEANSLLIMKDLKAEALKRGLQIVEATASKTSDVVTAAQSLIGKVDAIHIPNDNTAVASIGSIIAVGEKNKIPVFAADTGSFDAGVVAIAGYDRFLLGKRLAEYAIKILKGEKASALPVLRDHPVQFYVNIDAAKKMGMPLDPVLDKKKLQGFVIRSGQHNQS